MDLDYISAEYLTHLVFAVLGATGVVILWIGLCLFIGALVDDKIDKVRRNR